MAVRYEIDKPRQMVFSHACGRVCRRELADHRERLAADPDFDPSMNQLYEMQEVSGPTLSSVEVRLLADSEPVFSPVARRAIVVRSLASFGLVRMYQTYQGLQNDRTETIEVFLDPSAARRWVGLT